MRTILLAIAAAMALGLALPSNAQASHNGYSVVPARHYSGSGFSVYIGPRRHWYGRSRYYGRRYYPRRPIRRAYRRYNDRCEYWSRRCAANWGYGGANYRGCMRYYRCY